MVKRIFSLICILTLFFAYAGITENADAQTQVTITQTTPTVNSCSVVEGTISFAADSLAKYQLGLINILPYADFLAQVSWKATGTTRNFQITTYLTNYNTKDTAYWNLSQQWDTTGVYTNKPVNDTVTIKWNGLPTRYLGAIIQGLTGNREDVRIYFRVVLYRKP
ncbi:MAG: hypothetical protein UZ05_CHB002003100 [Chlorobi bacterium OLB5]|nr:MAG: hypothetical protein UZ05_CHB002003100 [Chlorobi bacterium OLB5]